MIAESARQDPELIVEESSGSKIPLFLCCLMLVINVLKPQEIYPSLAVFRLGLVTIAAAIGAAIYTGKLTMHTVWGTLESRLVLAMWVLGGLSVPLSVWQYGALEIWRLFFTINFLVYLGCAANSGTLYELRALMWSFVASVAFLAGVVLTAPTSVHGSARVSTTMTYDPNDLAMVMVTAIPIALSLMPKGSKAAKALLAVTAVAFLLTILKTGSRGGVIGVSVVGLMLLRRPPGKLSIGVKILALAVPVLMMFFAPADLKERFSALVDGEDYNLSVESGSGGGRLTIWGDGMKIFIHNPLIGVGPGQFNNAMGQTYGSRSWKAAHNSYLQIMVELGLGGLILLIWMIIVVWKNTRNRDKDEGEDGRRDDVDLSRGLRCALIGYLVCATFLSAAYSLINPFLLSFSAAVADGARRDKT